MAKFNQSEKPKLAIPKSLQNDPDMKAFADQLNDMNGVGMTLQTNKGGLRNFRWNEDTLKIEISINGKWIATS